MAGSGQPHLAAEEKFAPATAVLKTTGIALLVLTIPFGVLSLVGVAAGVSDLAEVPGFLAFLGGVVLMIVLLVAVLFAFTPMAYILNAQGIRTARRFVRPVFVPYVQVRNVALRQFPGPPFAAVKLGSWGLFGCFGRYRVEPPGLDQGLRHLLGERNGGVGDRAGAVLSLSGRAAEVLRCAAGPALRYCGLAALFGHVRRCGLQLKTVRETVFFGGY